MIGKIKYRALMYDVPRFQKCDFFSEILCHPASLYRNLATLSFRMTWKFNKSYIFGIGKHHTLTPFTSGFGLV